MAHIPDDVAERFAEVFGVSDCAPEVVSALQCSEVEALAGMLAALGATGAAENWRAEHLAEEDCTDDHQGGGA
ncbi:hypothetical protein ACI2L4_25090 [Streptomyces sparsogenes]|uniref:hypothetical protein n=1 Tax=Streptomyces sparsogenes TaxID=67365 RepID=UPI00384AC3FA